MGRRRHDHEYLKWRRCHEKRRRSHEWIRRILYINFFIMNRVFDYLTHVTRLLDVIKIQMKSRAFTVKRLWWTLDRFRLNVAFYLQNIFLHNDTEVLLWMESHHEPIFVFFISYWYYNYLIYVLNSITHDTSPYLKIVASYHWWWYFWCDFQVCNFYW